MQKTQQYPTDIRANREAYLEARADYLRKDSLRAFDAYVVLSPQEEQANQRLLALQQQIIREYKEKNFFPPAHYFYLSQAQIARTPLFKLLRQMPKGGALHLHPEASGDMRWVVDKAVATPNCYVFWEESHASFVKGQIQFFQPRMVPKGFYSTWSLNKTIPQFKDSLYNLLTFNAQINDPGVDIWKEFEKRFQRLHHFVYYQPIFKAFMEAAFRSLADDGIQHVEMRSFLGNSLYDLRRPPDYYNGDTLVRYYQEATAAVQQDVPDFTAKLIYTNLRIQSQEVIDRDVEKAFQMRRRYPDWVKAYDLVAEEDRGNTTLYYLNTWLKMDSLEEVYGIDLPLCLHDGESDWASVQNLYDAVLLGSDRIGHGFNLFLFPTLQEAIKAHDVCVEVSPLSNQILGYLEDLRVHPARGWLRDGIQCTISSDDPGVFGYQGVTYDYWSIFLAWELDLQAMKKLIINSIQYSYLNEEEKVIAMQHWQRRWEKFIDEIVDSPQSTVDGPQRPVDGP